MSSVPEAGGSPGRGHGNTVLYACLKNPMDRGACQATVHRVAKSQTQLKQLDAHTHTHTPLWSDQKNESNFDSGLW